MLTGLHGEGSRSHTPQGCGGRGRGQVCGSTFTFTVSLGIFLLEASFRGQSSSGGERVGSPLYPLLSGVLGPPQEGILHPLPRNSLQAPGDISVLTWGHEFFYLWVFALEDDTGSVRHPAR